MLTLPVLYSFRRCPYAMRARMALYYSGQQVDLREVILKSKPAQLLDASAKGTVPVLISDGAVVDESLEIMQWALERGDPDDWLVSAEGSVSESELIQECDDEFKPILDKYKYFDRYPELTQEEYCQQAWPFLCCLNQRIKTHQGFLARNSFSVLDAAIFPFIRQFSHCDKLRFSQLNCPELQAWLDVCTSADLFTTIMKKYVVWSENENNSIVFGRHI